MSTTVAALERREQATTRLSAYVELIKPRITFMVLLTVGAAAWIAGDGVVSAALLFHTLLGTTLVAASSSALNQWLERDRDALMDRTMDRPLPSGRLAGWETCAFAALALAAGECYLAMTAGPVTALIGLATWAGYVWIYTPLKARTAWNTAVGAVAGAAPVWMGWTAVGQPLNWQALGLFLALFLWQFPHFMAIAWLCRRQYARAGVQMLTVVDPSGSRAAWHALVAAAALAAIALAPALTAPTSLAIRLAAAALGAGQLVFAFRFWRRRDDASARGLLRASLVYLPLLMLLLALEPWL